MKLDYALQRKIDDHIIRLVSSIGEKCRGRIEIDDGSEQVIEFESNDDGKWQRTSWHHKGGDDAFSIFFSNFKFDSPLLEKLRKLVKESS